MHGSRPGIPPIFVGVVLYAVLRSYMTHAEKRRGKRKTDAAE